MDNNKLDRASAITQEMRALERNIVTLNAERRTLIRQLWADDGLSQREIAQALNLTNQTIWNEIHRKDDSELVA